MRRDTGGELGKDGWVLVSPEGNLTVARRPRASAAGWTWALAHAIYPGELFAPEDPIVQNLYVP